MVEQGAKAAAPLVDQGKRAAAPLVPKVAEQAKQLLQSTTVVPMQSTTVATAASTTEIPAAEALTPAEFAAGTHAASLHFECHARVQSNCSDDGRCEWHAGENSCCEADMLAGPDAASLHTECHARSEANCTRDGICDWHADEESCCETVTTGVARRIGRRRLDSDDSLDARVRTHGLVSAAEGLNSAGRLKLHLPGLRRSHAYTAFCTAVELPLRRCRRGPEQDECVESTQRGRLVEFESGRSVVRVDFSTSKDVQDSDGPSLVKFYFAVGGITILSLGAVVGAVALKLNWSKLSRRYWARQVKLTQSTDHQLMACPVASNDFSALG